MKTNKTITQRIPESLNELAEKVAKQNSCKKIDAFEFIKQGFNGVKK
jgi:predicted transcriptional regulator